MISLFEAALCRYGLAPLHNRRGLILCERVRSPSKAAWQPRM